MSSTTCSNSNILRWSGCKRLLAEEIVSYIPYKEYNTYYEPFCGSCSVFKQVQNTRNCKYFYLSDKNSDLISLLQLIKDNPKDLYLSYKKMWKKLSNKESIDDKKEYYLKIREKFNESRNPDLFFFLLRTCYNSLVRYNSKNEFNYSFHLTRNGMTPDKIKKLLKEWTKFFNDKKVIIKCHDFSIIETTEKDLMFCDPPYVSTKGMYFCDFNNKKFEKFIKKSDGFVLFTYDGKVINREDTSKSFKDFRKVFLQPLNSSFRRLKNDKDALVRESLFIKL